MVDFAKAFDTVNHQFLLDTLEFFNFGENFINMTKTILSGRRGGILVDGEVGSIFNFETGSGQGDPPSALYFILGIELLILRLRSTPMLQKQTYDGITRGSGPAGVEAYADDLNILVKMDVDIIKKVISILDDFFNLSGLKCNLAKTNFVPAGLNCNNVIGNIERETGITRVDDFTLLGLKYDNKLEQLSKNADIILEKSRKIVLF